jgi:tyrosyl-tRNA synthetase
MNYLGAKPNIAIIMGILPGTDGVVKMSKSLGNHIPISTTPEDMFGKVMSIPDFAMPAFARLVTRWTPDRIQQAETDLAAGRVHPRDAKMALAQEIVGCFYGDESADRAHESFVRTFQQHEIPEDLPEYCLQAGQTILDVLVMSNMAASRSEGRRLIEQKGVRLDGNLLEDGQAVFPHSGVLQVGKRHFIKVVAK